MGALGILGILLPRMITVEYYNGPEAMRQYTVSLGIPVEDSVLDYAGQRTYDTCYRARAIFGVERALLVTQ